MSNAIYLRVSSDKQSSEMQARAISIFMESRGLKIDLEFKDEGFTGGNDNRPAFKSLLNEVKGGKVEFLIIYRLDRLFRSLSDLLKTIDVFKTYGTKLISIQDNIDLSTPAGIFQMQILGAVAELEKSIISERTKSGLLNARAKGIQLGRPIKYGIEFRDEVLYLTKHGRSLSQISSILKVNKTTIYNIIKKNNMLKYIENKPKVLKESAE